MHEGGWGVPAGLPGSSQVAHTSREKRTQIFVSCHLCPMDRSVDDPACVAARLKTTGVRAQNVDLERTPGRAGGGVHVSDRNAPAGTSWRRCKWRLGALVFFGWRLSGVQVRTS